MRLYVKATSAGESVEWGFGVLPVTRDAFAAGAVPEPLSDQQGWYASDGGLFSTDTDAGPRGREYTYDIRSMRRIPSRDTALVHVMENGHSANSLDYGLRWQLLLKLP